MKSKRIFLCSLIVVAIGFVFAVKHSSAQPPGTRGDDVAQERLLRLYRDLSASKQTNFLNQVNEVLSAMQTLDSTKEASKSLVLLNRLRSGRTNEAIAVLEIQLDGALMDLARHTNEIRETELTTLRNAKKYREQFPRKSGNPDMDDSVARAFELLEKKSPAH